MIPLPSAGIRLIATDLDGTIVPHSGRLSDRTVAAFAAARAAGFEILLVTGRPPRWIPEVADQLGHDGLVICCNGAELFDRRSETIVESWLLPAASVAEIVDVVGRQLPGVCFAADLGARVIGERAYLESGIISPGTEEAARSEFGRVPAVKLLIANPELSPDALLDAVGALIPPTLATITHSASGGDRTALTEVSAPGITKATTLAKVTAELGLTSREVIAFGDMPNDLAMLDFAGFAVATGNAHPLVRAAADYVTATVDQDGVAIVIEQLVSQLAATPTG